MTSRYHGIKISGSQQWGVFATAKKTIGLDSNFTRALRCFVHLLGVVARRRHETC